MKTLEVEWREEQCLSRHKIVDQQVRVLNGSIEKHQNWLCALCSVNSVVEIESTWAANCPIVQIKLINPYHRKWFEFRWADNLFSLEVFEKNRPQEHVKNYFEVFEYCFFCEESHCCFQYEFVWRMSLLFSLETFKFQNQNATLGYFSVFPFFTSIRTSYWFQEETATGSFQNLGWKSNGPEICTAPQFNNQVVKSLNSNSPSSALFEEKKP